jgi:hypothetical protein
MKTTCRPRSVREKESRILVVRVSPLSLPRGLVRMPRSAVFARKGMRRQGTRGARLRRALAD